MVKVKIDDIIAALGGPARVARLTRRDRNAVYNWRRRGIPLATRHAIEAALGKFGMQPHPSVWGARVYRRMAQR
jgi:hypothetical protein